MFKNSTIRIQFPKTVKFGNKLFFASFHFCRFVETKKVKAKPVFSLPVCSVSRRFLFLLKLGGPVTKILVHGTEAPNVRLFISGKIGPLNHLDIFLHMPTVLLTSTPSLFTQSANPAFCLLFFFFFFELKIKIGDYIPGVCVFRYDYSIQLNVKTMKKNVQVRTKTTISRWWTNILWDLELP